MGRDILFKGKQSDNGEWVDGYYAVIGAKDIIIKNKAEYYYSVDDGIKKIHGNKIFYVNPETVCQCTGLTDKNGRKIFEGDIVKTFSFKDTLMVIQFIGGEFCLTGKHGEYLANIRYIKYAGVNEAEVIGNVFDNPELLNR